MPIKVSWERKQYRLTHLNNFSGSPQTKCYESKNLLIPFSLAFGHDQIGYLTWVTAAGRFPDFSRSTSNLIFKKVLMS